jgi:hypothetical protein
MYENLMRYSLIKFRKKNISKVQIITELFDFKLVNFTLVFEILEL